MDEHYLNSPDRRRMIGCCCGIAVIVLALVVHNLAKDHQRYATPEETDARYGGRVTARPHIGLREEGQEVPPSERPPRGSDENSVGPAFESALSKEIADARTTIQYRIVDETGRPIRGAEISPSYAQASGSRSARKLKPTDKDGYTTFYPDDSCLTPDAKIRVFASAHGFIERCVKTPCISGENKDVVITLQKGRVVRGRVIGMDKQDVKHIYVEVDVEDDETKPPEYADWYGSCSVRPDEDGEFLLDDIPPIGGLALTVSHVTSWKYEIPPPLPVVADGPHVTVKVERKNGYVGEGSLHLQLANVKGKLQARVVFYDLNRQEVFGQSYYVRSLNDCYRLPLGRYRVAVWTGDASPSAGSEADLYGTADVLMEHDKLIPLSLQMQRGGTVRLKVVDEASSQPLTELNIFYYVEYVPEPGGEDIFGYACGSQETNYAFTESKLRGVPPGWRTFRVYDPRSREKGREQKRRFDDVTVSVLVEEGKVAEQKVVVRLLTEAQPELLPLPQDDVFSPPEEEQESNE